MNQRVSWLSLPATVLQADVLYASAASYSSKPDPVGVKVYASQSFSRLLPVGIIFCGVLLMCLVLAIMKRRKSRSATERHP